MDFSASEYQANPQIPIDLFVSKERGDASGGLRFADASGNLVYRVERQSHESTRKQVLFDSAGNALICIARNHVILSLYLYMCMLSCIKYWL